MGTTGRIISAIKAKQISLGPDGITVLALSGVSNRQDVMAFEDIGASGVLVGESLMRNPHPSVFIQVYNTHSFVTGVA